MGEHGKINKLQMGWHGVHEIAIYGAPCALIREFAERMHQQFPEMGLMYVDETHEPSSTTGLHGWTKEGDGARMSYHGAMLTIRQSLLRQAGLVIVNGNHFPAQEQLIIFHPEKENSLKKRIAQLTRVRAFVGPRADFDRLQHEGLDLTGALHFEHLEHDAFLQWWKTLAPNAPLYPLVLTGGRSSRMGQDKSLMPFNGRAQYLRIHDLFESAQMPAYLSCRKEQAEQYEWPQKRIVIDRILDIGPLAALVSAWMLEPTAAWLTVACDMPLLGMESIEQLLKARRPDAFATCLCIGPDGPPEPMATIWEPRAYPAVMQAISAGTTCPRKILQNHPTVSVEAIYPEQLTNVNTPEEWKRL